MQALSPHQARAQFLGEKELGWGGSRGGLAEEGRVLRRPFPLYRKLEPSDGILHYSTPGHYLCTELLLPFNLRKV